ncbi:hypothetical protein PROFUN_03883 [Planoprotostelium fungivorum]|uniref:non-specific serine/threonine protein kinase n=1 Tax=Planoprotostelium fungivorum TaxID=1890364 RepID=A0A2P6MTN6_9EUKA|nr:hypothetical protein PROFUN_03883 [Planoprotostelium fungivorum]
MAHDIAWQETQRNTTLKAHPHAPEYAEAIKEVAFGVLADLNYVEFIWNKYVFMDGGILLYLLLQSSPYQLGFQDQAIHLLPSTMSPFKARPKLQALKTVGQFPILKHGAAKFHYLGQEFSALVTELYGVTICSAWAKLDDASKPQKLAEWIDSLYQQLKLAHKASWYHCDISHKNIIVHNSHPMIIDWGGALEINNNNLVRDVIVFPYQDLLVWHQLTMDREDSTQSPTHNSPALLCSTKPSWKGVTTVSAPDDFIALLFSMRILGRNVVHLKLALIHSNPNWDFHLQHQDDKIQESLRDFRQNILYSVLPAAPVYWVQTATMSSFVEFFFSCTYLGKHRNFKLMQNNFGGKENQRVSSPGEGQLPTPNGLRDTTPKLAPIYLCTCPEGLPYPLLVPQLTYISFTTFFSGLPTGLQSPKISVGQQWLILRTSNRQAPNGNKRQMQETELEEGYCKLLRI